MKQKICSVIFSTGLPEESFLSLGAGQPRFLLPFAGRFTFLDFFLSAARRMGSELELVVTARHAELVHGYMERAWGESGWDILPFLGAGEDALLNKNMIQALKSILKPWVLLCRADTPLYADLAPLLSRIKRRTEVVVALVGGQTAPALLVEKGALLDQLADQLRRKIKASDALPAAHRHFLKHPRAQQAEIPGFLPRITTLDQYIDANLDVLARLDEYNRFFVSTPLHSGLHEKMPAVVERGGAVYNSMIADNAHVAGMVRGSMLFPGAVVSADAEVIDSVLLPGVVVGPGARLVRTLAGPGVVLPQNIKYHIGQDCRVGKELYAPAQERGPFCKGYTYVAAGALLPRGISIGANCCMGPGIDRNTFRRSKNISDGRRLGF